MRASVRLTGTNKGDVAMYQCESDRFDSHSHVSRERIFAQCSSNGEWIWFEEPNCKCKSL